MSTENPSTKIEEQPSDGSEPGSDSELVDDVAPVKPPKPASDKAKTPENKIIRLLEKNPLGMTLPEMAGGPRQVKKIKLLRPMLAEAIRNGLVMPVSQRAGNTVYRLVKYLGPR
jgi:hypothetical protein